MPQPDLIIFDFDGVLVDSEIIAARVEAELITQAGYEITAEEVSELYAGLTFKDILLRIEEVAAIPFQVIADRPGGRTGRSALAQRGPPHRGRPRGRCLGDHQTLHLFQFAHRTDRLHA